MQARGREGAGYNRFLGVPQHEQQAVPISDLLGNVVAHHRGGLRGKLRQSFSYLNQPNKIAGNRRSSLLRCGVENVETGRSRIEVNSVSAVVHRGIAIPVI